MLFGMAMGAYQSSVAAGEALLARKDAAEAKGRVDLYKFEIERLLMITEALWRVLKEKHGYSDEDLFNKLYEVDMQDGKLDGKVAATEPYDCPECSRKLAKHRHFCMYCGAPVSFDPFQR